MQNKDDKDIINDDISENISPESEENDDVTPIGETEVTDDFTEDYGEYTEPEESQESEEYYEREEHYEPERDIPRKRKRRRKRKEEADCPESLFLQHLYSHSLYVLHL